MLFASVHVHCDLGLDSSEDEDGGIEHAAIPEVPVTPRQSTGISLHLSLHNVHIPHESSNIRSNAKPETTAITGYMLICSKCFVQISYTHA